VTLSGKQRRHLRSLAHHLDPVVQLGRKGTTDAVLQQLDDALETHELLKVRLGRDCPQTSPETASWIEAHLAAEVVQIVGHVLVVYRRRAEDPTIELPRAAAGDPE
jgi:RNA-binding protein